MKPLLYFSLLVLLVGVGGCKKDLCHGVVCQNGGHCENGVCVCDSNWTGANCNTEKIPDIFVGTYHMVGTSQTWVAGQNNPPPSQIDEIVTITKIANDSLSIFGYHLAYIVGQPDTVSYLFRKQLAWGYHDLSFHRPFTDDSAFYSYSDGGMGGGSYKNLRGIKIH